MTEKLLVPDIGDFKNVEIIEVLVETSVIPKVNGVPINCIADTDLSVITTICCLVCTAATISVERENFAAR